MSEDKKSKNGCRTAWYIGLALGFTLPLGLGANPWIAAFVSILSGWALAALYLWAEER